MKLLALKLCNFRPFYGEHGLTLAKSDDRNITVIHGNNGSGKTALLNAFTWTLYEKFTAALASPEQLVNRRAIAEAKVDKPVSCWVELSFEHDGKQYRVRRECSAYRKKNGSVEPAKSDLMMQFVGDDGRWAFLPSAQIPEDVITRILPKSLHQYFFFDGERIENITRTDNRSEIAEATKKLLGVEVLDRAIKHLTTARKTLEEELEGIGDAETQSLLVQKRELEQEADQLQGRQLEIDQELEHQSTRRQQLRQKQLELTDLEGLQLQLNTLEEQEREIREKVQQSKKTLKRAISNRGYIVFLPKVATEFRALIREREQRGELPADIKQKFIQDLLDRQTCICGTELHEGTAACSAVQSWLARSGLSEIESATYRIEARVNELESQLDDFWQEVDREQASINHNKGTLERIQDDLEEIRDQLRHSPREDIRELQNRLDEVDAAINRLTTEKGANQEKIANLDLQAGRLGKQLKESRSNEKRQKLAVKRIEAAQEAIDLLKQVKGNRDQVFRQQLEQQIEELYGQISFKAYLPRLSDRYELSLVEVAGGQDVLVGASTGENQILSLSFIGSVIERVRQWSKAGLVMGPDSSTFPIVMDSPFGNLDEIYRRQVARLVPLLANQLVVMASQTQWRGEVEQEMQPRIGKEYVLTFNSPKSDCEEASIKRYGQVYPLVRQSRNEFEYTEMIEVVRE
ncbi:MAG: AAA family ATPase [Aphanocapsa sp. GSE-SYN-MK-11-07L]|jgi:DNA sulfur modification protein DndD|nr:AAA family ATPase [Aphanocapsa sp. GSE-SYN-MK-11-07L]